MTLSAALALAAPAPAGAEDTEPAVVPNGTFSSRQVPDGLTWASGIEGWTGNGVLGSAARAGHPQGFQAATLSYAGTQRSMSTRVRGVRAGATVTLSWDDNPDICAPAGPSGRPYTVTVAGGTNSPGTFTTNVPNKKPNWFIGRTYSFSAAEDAPEITFASTDTTNTQCPFFVTNIQAKQTAPPLTPPKGGASSDPCSGDAKDDAQCKDLAADKEKIEKCPPTSKECLAGVAGDGKAEKDGIAKETQAVDDFGKVPRDQNPNDAASQLCALPNALTSDVKPGDAVVPPSDWWFC
ncbi:hypothetical protein ACIQ9P_36230 [Kitasatospora sp. NPDC094019]|uniref:hypothetical protein n=1 Tax=Kitasatospora sp. NPDC094019 TaxID=3364091 RepID=UPI00381DE7EC